MSKPIAVIDMDGVLFDFEEKWRLVSERLSGVKANQVSDYYKLKDRYNVSEDHIMDVFKSINWSLVPAYKESKEAIDLLKDEYFIHICSSADESLLKDRIFSLESNELHFDKITLTGFGGIKSPHYVNADVVIDDYADHIKDAIKMSVPNVIMIDRNYKEDHLSIENISEAIKFDSCLDAALHLKNPINHLLKKQGR